MQQTTLPSNEINPVQRITALWALSEAAFGGALHALKIPFTGLFIGSSAVIFITLISYFDRRRGAIFKATLIVMIVKAVASPHSPVNAYLAVAIQGLLGGFLFTLIRSKRIAAFLLGFLSLLESSIQKVIVITIVFGQNIWEAIDLFSKYVLSQFLLADESVYSLSISKILIILYMSIHIIAGIIIGIWSPMLAGEIMQKRRSAIPMDNFVFSPIKQSDKKTKKRRRIWKKLSVLVIFMLATAIFVLSYFYPVFEKSKGFAALLMVFRSIMIMGLWYYFIGPTLLKYLRRFLDRRSGVYKDDINEILNIFPLIKQVIRHAWAETKDISKIKRIPVFVKIILIYLLTLNIDEPAA